MNISGDGFPDCKDPSMIPITIHVQDFVSSFEPQFIFSQWDDYDADFRKNLTSQFGDLEGIRENFNEFLTWLNENNPYDALILEKDWRLSVFFFKSSTFESLL